MSPFYNNVAILQSSPVAAEPAAAHYRLHGPQRNITSPSQPKLRHWDLLGKNSDMPNEKPSEFQVKISVPIPADAKQKIALEIQKAVMGEIAKLDLKGDLLVRPNFRFPNGHTQGIWIASPEAVREES